MKRSDYLDLREKLYFDFAQYKTSTSLSTLRGLCEYKPLYPGKQAKCFEIHPFSNSELILWFIVYLKNF